MSETQNKAFLLALASVSMETDKLTTDVVDLLREAITNDWSTEEIVNKLLPA